MRDFLKRRPAMVQDRFGPLKANELLGLAAVPWDHGMLRVAVHLMRARAAEASAQLAGSSRSGLTDGQIRTLCGALEACMTLEADLVALVEQAQKGLVK